MVIGMEKLLLVIMFAFLDPCMTSDLDDDHQPPPLSPVYSTPRPFTCGQRDRCSRRPDDLPFHATNCFCDVLCEVYGDCCKDYPKTSSKRITKLAKNTVSCERRPQIYPEGEVYIVKSCPKDYADSFVLEKCEDERATGDFLQLPVTGSETKVLYRNVYCAICAGDTNVTFWTVKINCNSKPSRYDETSIASSLLSSPRCTLEYNHPIGLPFRKCKSHFSKCTRNFEGDKRVEKKCKSYTSFVYASLHVFKNKHCAICNHVNETYLSCEDTRTPMPPMIGDTHGYTPPFSVSMDINQGLGRIAETKFGVGGTPSMVGSDIVLRSCSQGEVLNPFQEDCVVIECPLGSEFVAGDCTMDGTADNVMTEASSPRMTTEELMVTETVSSSSLYMESTSVVNTVPPTTPMVRRVMPNIVTDPSTSKIFEDVDCPLVMLNNSDYDHLANGSIRVFYAKRTYNPWEFITVDRNHFICQLSSVQTTRHPPANTTSSVRMFKFTMIQSLVSLIGLVVSMSSLLVVFVVYTILPPLRDLPGMCLMSLVASLFVAQCLFLFGTPRTELPDVCLTLGALMHYFFLAAFLWVNVLAIDICRTFAASGHQSHASCVRFSAYSFYAWTLPALIVGGSVALDAFQVHALYRPHYGEGLCWITSRRALLVLFALPMAILLFVNIILFTVTIFHICALDRITQKALAQNSYGFQTSPPPPSLQRDRNRFILCIQLSFIMGLTWVFGFLAALTDLHVLWYVFILFNTLQGAFLCIAFVCTKRVFKLLRRNKDEPAPRQPSSSLNGGRIGYSQPTYLFDSEARVIAQETSI